MAAVRQLPFFKKDWNKKELTVRMGPPLASGWEAGCAGAEVSAKARQGAGDARGAAALRAGQARRLALPVPLRARERSARGLPICLPAA